MSLHSQVRSKRYVGSVVSCRVVKCQSFLFLSCLHVRMCVLCVVSVCMYVWCDGVSSQRSGLPNESSNNRKRHEDRTKVVVVGACGGACVHPSIHP